MTLSIVTNIQHKQYLSTANCFRNLWTMQKRRVLNFHGSPLSLLLAVNGTYCCCLSFQREGFVVWKISAAVPEEGVC
jgi:hypothetical protein